MSNVVSPRGPLPPRVYWRRRLVVLAVLLGLVVLAGQLLSGGDDTEPMADRGPARPTAPAAEETAGQKKPEKQAGAEGAARQRASQRQRTARLDPKGRQGTREAQAAEPPVSLSGAASPLAQPAGPCTASAVTIVPDVEDTDAGGTVPLRLGLSTTGRQACTFSFGPDTVAVRVTSGDDLIWETLRCDRAIEPQSVVVRPGWLTYVTVPWTGRRDDEGCGLTGDFASPGYYWAEAAAVGGEPQRGQFQLQTPPPPPKPEPRPKRDDDRRSDDRTAEQRDQSATADEGSGDAARGSEESAPQRQTPQREQEAQRQAGQQRDEDGEGTRQQRRRDGQT